MSSAPASVTAAVLVPSKADVTGLVPVMGYDFNKGLDFEALLDSYRTMGFQGTSIGDAIDEINRMVVLSSHPLPCLYDFFRDSPQEYPVDSCITCQINMFQKREFGKLVPSFDFRSRSNGAFLTNLSLKTNQTFTVIQKFAKSIVARSTSGMLSLHASFVVSAQPLS